MVVPVVETEGSRLRAEAFFAASGEEGSRWRVMVPGEQVTSQLEILIPGLDEGIHELFHSASADGHAGMHDVSHEHHGAAAVAGSEFRASTRRSSSASVL